MKMSTNGTRENVEFKDQMPAYSYDVDSEMDPTRSLQDTSDATLDNFFSRPIKIASEEWGTGTTLGFDIDPWSLYFNNPRVINRIANYNLLKARLHIKVVINGNGFQYGRLIAAYLPLAQFDSLSSVSTLVPEDIVQASQWPHIFLDPTTSTGGEMILPFMYHKNYLSIPDAEWDQMGTLYFRTLNSLKHANGATDQVTVSVFAWATDVSMSVLTSEDPATIAPQSGMETEVDEANTEGVISKPATAIAKLSNALSVIPPLAPFALATSSVAGAVASAARSMGYCRPPITKNPEPFRAFPISHLAATNTPDTALKLSVDDKQELSVDTRIAGVGSSDPLSIKEIAKRESYLTTFNWNIGTAPETLLWNARIDPCTWSESTLTPKSYHFPACAMAALPFKYWTGSMRFRFQIVCSAFHKGRIKIVYDPNFLSTNEYNTNYLQVIDIADTQDFTLEFGNGQNVTLLDHHQPGLDGVTQMYSTSTYTAKEEGNGVVGVYVVNELTTPNSEVTNDISVNVFVSMGDDFEVFVPDDAFQAFTFKPTADAAFAAQSGAEADIVTEAQNTAEPSAPQHEQADTIGPGLQDNALINMVYTGESIMSFRTMLKRYNLWRREYINSVEQLVDFVGQRESFPFLRGSVTGAVDLADGVAPYNYVNTVMMHWVTYAFQGFRGGIRYKFLINNTPRVVAGATSTTNDSTLYVQRRGFGDSNYSNFRGQAQGNTTQSEASSTGVADFGAGSRKPLTGVLGSLYANSKVNPTAEFEVPYYSPFRFTPGKTENWTTGQNLISGYDFYLKTMGGPNVSLDCHVASAEDFQVYMWTGLPRMFYERSPPPA